MRKLITSTLIAGLGLVGFATSSEAMVKPAHRCRVVRAVELPSFDVYPFSARGCDRVDLIMTQAGGTYGNADRCGHMGGEYAEFVYGQIWSVCVGIDF